MKIKKVDCVNVYITFCLVFYITWKGFHSERWHSMNRRSTSLRLTSSTSNGAVCSGFRLRKICARWHLTRKVIKGVLGSLCGDIGTAGENIQTQKSSKTIGTGLGDVFHLLSARCGIEARAVSSQACHRCGRTGRFSTLSLRCLALSPLHTVYVFFCMCLYDEVRGILRSRGHSLLSLRMLVAGWQQASR